MAINRIDGGIPSAAISPEIGKVTEGARTEAARVEVGSVGGPDAAKGASATEVSPAASTAASPLSRLHAGEIGLHEYLDLKVDAATSQLQGLAPADLDFVKGALRERLLEDPDLMRLVEQAAFVAASGPEK